MSGKRKIFGSVGIVLVVAIVGMLLGYFYIGVKTPAEQVDKVPACAVNLQRDFITARNQIDPATANKDLANAATATQKHDGYANSVSCAYIVFSYDLRQGKLTQAQDLLNNMKTSLQHDPSYLGDSLIYQQAQSDFTIAQAGLKPGTDSP